MNYALISVRSSSSRLPKKCFLKFGEGTILEHIIKRTKSYNFKPFVCTTRKEEDNKIATIALKMNCGVFRGSENNKLLRWLECCQENQINYFHTIDADDPFFCGEEINRSLKLLENYNYDFVEPSPSSSNGGATVGYSIKTKFLEKVCNGLTSEENTEMIPNHIHKINPKNNIKMKDPNKYIITQRMTLDYWEDYILLSSIREILGNNATRKNIFELFKNNPQLENINGFRNSEWKKRQIEQSQ